LKAVHAIDRVRRPVRDAALESYRQFVEEYVPEQVRADYLAALQNEARPSTLPAYDRVLVSAEGNVWAQVYEPEIEAPHDWDVFGGEGRFLGTVHIAAGMYPLTVTEDAVVGVWRDSLAVEHVRVYRFTRS
jgi:hypothetical protein